MKRQGISLVVLTVFLVFPGSAAVSNNTPQHDQDKSIVSGDAPQNVNFGNEVPPSASMPMYDAFRKFCIATGARPENIEKAMTISGVRFHKRGPAATTDPMPMDTTAWDMEFEGHKLTLNAGHRLEAYGRAMVQKGNVCSITSWNGDEKVSVAALHRWAGISRSADRPLRQGTLTLYEFEVRGTAMIALKNDDAGRLAKAEGRTWHLTIMDSSVMLAHFSPPFPRP